MLHAANLQTVMLRNTIHDVEEHLENSYITPHVTAANPYSNTSIL